jgi:hypothetical protein
MTVIDIGCWERGCACYDSRIKDETVEVVRREWVGLTDDDLEKLKLLTFEKEINADGEEQEAVNLDQLIRATEQLCKEKNHE